MRRTILTASALMMGALQAASAAAFDPEVDLRKAELAVDDARKTNTDLSGKLQWLATQRSFVGDASGAMAAFDEVTLLRQSANLAGAGANASDLARLAAAQEEDAINAIVREAGKHRVVILNEAHHVPLHRAFAMRLARELRRIGYNWLAGETFEHPPFEKGYLALSDGYYSREPAFGNFLRDAAADGWQLVPYEPFDQERGGSAAEQIDRRERGEARNLVDRIFAQHPDAKVFIYVGYGHLRERPRPGDGKGTVLMAAYLSQMTGLDPLTIDQTTLMAHTDAAAEHPLYAAALARQTHEQPFVLRGAEGGYEVFGGYRYAVDMQVVHPRYGIDADSGRPVWMRTLSGYKPVVVPEAMRATDTPHYVYAYPEGQPDDAVPADIVQLRPGQPQPSLLLPAGQFRFVIRQ